MSIEKIVQARFEDICRNLREVYPDFPYIQLFILDENYFDIYATDHAAPKIVFTKGALVEIAALYLFICANAHAIFGEALDDRDGPDLDSLGKQRALLNIVFLTTFVDFILAHEIAHIINGHLGLAESLGLRLSEAEFFEMTGLHPKERRAIELDADTFAALSVSKRKLMVDLPIAFRDLEKRFGKDATLAALSGLTVAAMFKLFAHHADSDGEPEVSVHPADHSRMMLASVLIVRDIMPSDTPPQDVTELAHLVAISADGMVDQCRGKKLSGIDQAIDDRDAIVELHEVLEGLRPRFAPFARNRPRDDKPGA